jgi:hypothetical protein
MNLEQKLYTDLLIKCITNSIYKDDRGLMTGATTLSEGTNRQRRSSWPAHGARPRHKDGAAIVAERAGAPSFATVVDLWRRSKACMIWTTAKKKRMVGLLSGGRD